MAEKTDRVHDASDGTAPADPSEQPDLLRLVGTLKTSLSAVQVAVMGLFLLALLFALDAAAGFVIPVVLAHLFDRLLSPVVRWQKQRGVPTPIGAALVVVVFLAGLGGGAYSLAGPAAEWIESAPRNLQVAEYKLRGLKEPLQKMQEAAKEVEAAADMDGEGAQEESVQVQEQSMSGVLMSQTQSFIAGLLIMLFLLYFLLASGDLLLRKLMWVLPRFRHRRNAVRIIRRTERDLSYYLVTVVLINTGLGIAVAFGLYLVGMPNPALWGVLAGLLNFVPYLGPLVNIVIVGVVAVVSFDSVGRALLAPIVYLVINGIEGSIVTPAVLGWRLRLNPVVVFIALTFWTWMWGIPGALLAVPLLATIKITCDSVELLRPVGELLGR